MGDSDEAGKKRRGLLPSLDMLISISIKKVLSVEIRMKPDIS